ncbi:MAG: hypothetical protein ACODAD_15215 [Planctomycetota bacterium]
MADISVQTTLRIPGNWSHAGELLERIPDGFRLTPQALILPDGAAVELQPKPPDDQFAKIFESSCREPATDEEMEIVKNYAVNVCLLGPGGTMEAARRMLQAGAALVRAGGAGVFIDNSGLAHGGENWIMMAEDGGPDALSFAFVNIVRGTRELRTMGMHVLGQRDVVMEQVNPGTHEDAIIEIVRYICNSDKPIEHGHVLADVAAPRFQAVATRADNYNAGSPMHNPYGRLKLVSMKDIAENN